ncbi:uncharacterized protein LOC143281757 [Babylonia areolata]|uniref:uncharacterized protein LOC143281757 n=1 Tax=Babylonia areolata TaxID=304850 RepID=UPI003FD6BE4D
MPDMEESLFSLELVVEKLYIPHVVCRFPAVTFRLLDFPTIVINHVEDDLGKAIRRQISFDPDYQLPEQFCEIKDKHGNFMIKKGKSCLFKMVAQTLKNHLSNTPLYVMVIDMFPEVPKLVGNSTVPLNVLIDAICADLVRIGPTVPSVHGDKGLFKIYNLMGKEIGYFVLGFRLLCLGPSLIPHLPEAALVKRQSKKQRVQQQKQNKQLVEMVQLSQGEGGEDEEEDLIETRTWGSMTDAIKHDVMMQTVEMDHKGVHVDIQTPSAPTMPSAAVQPTVQHQVLHEVQRHTQHSGTQTDKKGIKMAFNAKQKVFEDLVALEDQEHDDEIIVTNMVCPPPLFFNSEAKPHIEVEDDSYSLDTDMSVSDDITIDSISDEEDDKDRSFSKTKTMSKEPVLIDKGQIIAPPAPNSYQNVPLNVKFANQNQQKSHHSRSAAPQPSVPQSRGGGFPLLAALMNELLCIQNPSLFQGVQMHPATVQQAFQSHGQSSEQRATEKERVASRSNDAEGSPDQKRLEEVNVNVESSEKEYAEEKDIFSCGRKSHRKCAHPHTGVPKDKSWLRVIPEYGTGQKKSKLMFGLTNTQRLRLQKSNPAWLKSMERAQAVNKNGRQTQMSKNDSGDEMNVSHYSDTLTEVRRQAQKELEKTAANDSIASATISQKSSASSPPRKMKSRTRSKSPKKTPPRGGRKPIQAMSPKSQVRKTPTSGRIRRRSDDSSEPTSARPCSVDPSVKNIISPDPGLVPPLATGGTDDAPMSARSMDQPSSARSRSIEVRMPSVQTSQDEGSEATITDSEEEDLPLPDESFSQKGHQKRPSNFPSYLKQSESLPLDSIEGRPNQSLNTTTGLDENSPLESTRNYHPDVGSSKNMQSTDDFDTKQTFHSTSEPELQGLVSDEEQEPLDTGEKKGPAMKFPILNPMLSQNSPVPSTRRSVAKLDMSISQVPVTPRGESSTPRSSRSGSPKRPTPRPRRPLRDLRESVHTESISSYVPSDPENMGASLSSGDGNYSDDFMDNSSRASPNKPERPRLIPSTKLGYTIH